MARYIDADVLQKNLKYICTGGGKWGEAERMFIEAFSDFVDGIPTIAVENDSYKWIPVTEGLPKEEHNRYWVCTDSGHQLECRWTNANPFFTQYTTDWHWNPFDLPQYSKVVAWMPLPKPYIEQNEECDEEA